MKSTTLRILIPICIGVLAMVGFALGIKTGTLSAIGWDDIILLCPLGALATMLSSHTIVPRAVISLAIALVLIVFVGRAFCGWICPVPVTRKLRHAFSKRESDADKKPNEKAVERTQACDSAGKIDSRHVVLLGSLASAAIFGFPVFCLICPIGLSFATLFLLVALFGGGDVTWSIVVVPLLLLAEVVFFRKWCSRICPLAAFMSLVAKLNKTFVPTVDKSACIKAQGGACDRCAQVCEAGIHVQDASSPVPLNECIKCRSCVENCPTRAIAMPLLPARKDALSSHHADADSNSASSCKW